MLLELEETALLTGADVLPLLGAAALFFTGALVLPEDPAFGAEPAGREAGAAAPAGRTGRRVGLAAFEGVRLTPVCALGRGAAGRLVPAAGTDGFTRGVVFEGRLAPALFAGLLTGLKLRLSLFLISLTKKNPPLYTAFLLILIRTYYPARAYFSPAHRKSVSIIAHPHIHFYC